MLAISDGGERSVVILELAFCGVLLLTAGVVLLRKTDGRAELSVGRRGAVCRLDLGRPSGTSPNLLAEAVVVCLRDTEGLLLPSVRTVMTASAWAGSIAISFEWLDVPCLTVLELRG